MISYIRGTVIDLDTESSRIVVDVSGVGYEVMLPAFVMRALVDQGKSEGDEITLQTYYHVSERQPKPLLVGFNSQFERRFFEKLIDVEGIGPAKAARAFVFSVSTVAGAIEDGDAKVLEKMPGIGARAAQKIIATLREKVAEFALLKDEGYSNIPAKITRKDFSDEAVEVLTGLGYKKTESKAKVDEAIQLNPDIKDMEELIRNIFKAEKK